MSSIGTRTVLDFDLRQPGLAGLLGQAPEHEGGHDMGQLLRGEIALADHALRRGTNLGLALNSAPVPTPAELLQSRSTEALLANIETKYAPELMLFDLPPMLVADDAHGFLRSVDAALIVVEADRTPIRQIDLVERQVAELTAVAGVVLNKCSYAQETSTGDYGGYA